MRHGGGEAGLANFQPLCVACHQLKTNRNSAAEARRRRQAAFQERETPPSSPPLTPTQPPAARKRDASAGSAAADEPREPPYGFEDGSETKAEVERRLPMTLEAAAALYEG